MQLHPRIPKHTAICWLRGGPFALGIAPGFCLHTQQADSGLPAHTGSHMLTGEHTHTHVWARTLAGDTPCEGQPTLVQRTGLTGMPTG